MSKNTKEFVTQRKRRFNFLFNHDLILIFVYLLVDFVIADIWKSISQEAKDLITEMLTFKPEHRPSANEVLAHDWFINASNQQLTSDAGILKRLGNFSVIQLSSNSQKPVKIIFYSRTKLILIENNL